MRNRITAALTAVVALMFMCATAATAAATTRHVPGDATGYLHFVSHPDIGDAGPWAADTGVGTVQVVQDVSTTVPLTDCTGKYPAATTCYAFTSDVTFRGDFTTVPGTLTPNQSGVYAGDHVHGIVHGRVDGTEAISTFYATALPHFTSMRINGGLHSNYWPEYLFPASTVVDAGSGLSAPTYSFTYTVHSMHREWRLVWVWEWRRHRLHREWRLITVTSNEYYNENQAGETGNITG
jgi:hypothetical protein